MQNLYMICSICGKKHWCKLSYKEIEACFGCGKYEYMIWDCPQNKKFITRKPKKENMEDKRKPSAQGWVFAMNHRDAQVIRMW